MHNLFMNSNGMNIIGQGGKIILVSLPFAAVAVILQFTAPSLVSFPSAFRFLKPYSLIFFVPGLALWLTAVFQLLLFFPMGKLITNGAYSVCRNPIYSSFIVFILPGFTVLTMTWGYLLVSAVMFAAVTFLIKKEENQLFTQFGQEYSDYCARVSRIFPLIRPAARK